MGVGEVSGPRDRAPACGWWTHPLRVPREHYKAPAVAPRGLFVSAHKIGVVDFAKGSLLGGARGKCVSLNFGPIHVPQAPSIGTIPQRSGGAAAEPT